MTARALSFDDPAGMAKAALRLVAFLMFAALIVSGTYDRLDNVGAIRLAPLALLAALLVWEIVELAGAGAETGLPLFTLGLWVALGIRIAVQATGALASPLLPLEYIGFAALSGLLGPRRGLALFACLLAIESGWTWLSGAGQVQWVLFLFHAAYLAGAGLGVGAIVYFQGRSAGRAERELERIRGELSEFQRDDTVHRLSGLSEGGRRKEDLRSVLALDDSFRQALESGRGLLGADTLALYWRPDEGGDFKLREAASTRDDLVNDAGVTEGEGALGIPAARRKTYRVSGAGERAPLPHNPGGVFAEHIMIVPLVVGNEAKGILSAERMEGHKFVSGDEKVASVIGRRLVELHQHALLVRRREAEAARFRSLANLGHRLSRTLDLAGIIESVVRTGKALADPAASLVALPDEDGDLVIAAVDGDASPALRGVAVPEGSLAAWVAGEQEYMNVRDLADKTRKTPVLGRKMDPPRMRSVLLQPLPLGGEKAGVLVLFSREPEAFSGYVTRATGILADMAAVSIRNALLYAEMERRAVTDGLTGLVNHGAFQERFSEELERAGRLGNKVALILCDIDHFKSVNDTHGHPVGDEVLKGVARVLRGSIRKVDTAARYGGEEFVLVLVGTGAEGAVELAERIRHKVGELVFEGEGGAFRVTMSLGIAVYPADAMSKEDLIDLADQALYHAKDTGRNRTVAARKLPEARSA